MEILTEYVELKVADGTAMRAYVARPKDPGTSVGLLVGQEAFGVNAHIRDVTERFARKGFVSIAPEVFHRTASGFEGRYDDFQTVIPHMKAMTEAGNAADLRAAYEWLIANHGPKLPVASVGFCMGGRLAFLGLLTLPLKCAASFYGGGIAPGASGPGLIAKASELHGPMLFCWGGLDKHITPEHARAVADGMRAAGKPFVNVEFSDADHGFFCDARPTYSPAAAAEAWPLTLAFLAAHTGARPSAKPGS
jgi:carboxymethylenebutenolidase